MNYSRLLTRRLCLAVLLFAAACEVRPSSQTVQTVMQAPFGTTSDGEAVEVYTLTNANGVEVRAITYGGIIVSLRVPDKDGQLGDVVLGYDTLEGYLTNNSPYLGALIGRFGNRIGKGIFTLDEQTYSLAVNNGPNHLHGGLKGFDKVVWQAESFDDEAGVGVVFTYTSVDGEEGYPGTLSVRVTYRLTGQNALIVAYHATTDKATPINLTQHTYFNLAGPGTKDILGHQLTLHADRFTPVDSTMIPTGELRNVAGTPFDFTQPTAIGARIDQQEQQLIWAGGYDHNFVLDGPAGELSLACRLSDPSSGRVLEIFTTEPGLQFYSGNFLMGQTGKGGATYVHRGALCLESQHFPDSINQPTFPSTLQKPGEPYRQTTVHRFTAE